MMDGMKGPSETDTRSSIAAETGVGAVHLAVTDGERAEEFYRDLVGLTELSRDGETISFGVPGRELVVLHPGASGPVVPRRTGLYHLAILVPSRRELARVIARLTSRRFPNSPTDHVMTKSDYLWDPDGNGIEIYTETPEDGVWTFTDGGFAARDTEGNLRSGRDPIDLERLFAELGPEDDLTAPMPQETKMGHVHLHVRDVDEAVGFYSELMGFDVMGMSREIGMAFVSAGGYHHHLGLNTWAGEGASPPPSGTAGLRFFTVELPTEGDLEWCLARLEAGGVEVASHGDGGRFVSDPSGNRVRLAVRG